MLNPISAISEIWSALNCQAASSDKRKNHLYPVMQDNSKCRIVVDKSSLCPLIDSLEGSLEVKNGIKSEILSYTEKIDLFKEYIRPFVILHFNKLENSLKNAQNFFSNYANWEKIFISNFSITANKAGKPALASTAELEGQIYHGLTAEYNGTPIKAAEQILNLVTGGLEFSVPELLKKKVKECYRSFIR